MASSSDRRRIAETTAAALQSGSFVFAKRSYDLASPTQHSERHTHYYSPNHAIRLSSSRRHHSAEVTIVNETTLRTARRLSTASHGSTARIGVLSFASPTKPGGGFADGEANQEASIVRSSNIYPTLISRSAQKFYSLHRNNAQPGIYSHAMIYSPRILVFRGDTGEWHSPFEIDVVTCAAVDARIVRAASRHDGMSVEREIEVTMKERMSRILALFEHKAVRHIVLGAFGAGSMNSAKVIARIWADLLIAHGAPFKVSFETVTFAVAGRPDFDDFMGVFGRRGHRVAPKIPTVPTLSPLVLPHPQTVIPQVSPFPRNNAPLPFGQSSGRTFRKWVAETTLAAIQRRSVVVNGVSYDITDPVRATKYRTVYYDPAAAAQLMMAPTQHVGHSEVSFWCLSIVSAAHRASRESMDRLGVFNFASSTTPGGRFMEADGQEEALVRSTSLHESLITNEARAFYTPHSQNAQDGFYTHSMLYSPSVVVLRDDRGNWTAPFRTDIITCTAIDSGTVYNVWRGRGYSENIIGLHIESRMRERITCVLCLFEKLRIPRIILSGFGTRDDSRNSVVAAARLWADLLNVPEARFKTSFTRVIFAIPDHRTYAVFMKAFEEQVRERNREWRRRRGRMSRVFGGY